MTENVVFTESQIWKNSDSISAVTRMYSLKSVRWNVSERGTDHKPYWLERYFELHYLITIFTQERGWAILKVYFTPNSRYRTRAINELPIWKTENGIEFGMNYTPRIAHSRSCIIHYARLEGLLLFLLLFFWFQRKIFFVDRLTWIYSLDEEWSFVLNATVVNSKNKP